MTPKEQNAWNSLIFPYSNLCYLEVLEKIGGMFWKEVKNVHQFLNAFGQNGAIATEYVE